MNKFDAILKLTESDLVNAGIELPKIQLHKWLVFGQTDYLCRYGTLSDGHEKFTPAQKYAQALREYYGLAENSKRMKAQAKIAMADYLDAKSALDASVSAAEKLRNEGKMELAEAQLTTCLVTAEDQMRMIKTYAAVCNELGPVVEKQYPNGIEQAEMDNWVAVAKYRNIAGGITGNARMDNIPLPAHIKAELGMAYQRVDMVAPLMVEREKEIRELPTGSVAEFLGLEVKKDEVTN